jgi:hypothetical protein
VSSPRREREQRSRLLKFDLGADLRQLA